MESHVYEFDPQKLNEYMKLSRLFIYRRLAALAVICLCLLIPLFIINAQGWSELVGGQHAGGAWVLVGIGVVICSVGAVVLDVFLRWRR
ncbi:MAG: hypothetical protein K6T63_06550 [Alicyclobacillus herbarius]|uniref:hypothetical protein n=1 Tax=Alicyclobacillus herbarius TaxID=122960 RepID=UPI0003F72EEA|nr:hypothetical protein [Alicyclobacillus herbarius]MCL6632281.1 hypothetical protein [Alicyclobacillus herbarius]